MTLKFPPQFDPFHMVAAPQLMGSVADEDVQLIPLQQEMARIGAGCSEEVATAFLDRVEALIASDLPPQTSGLEHTFTPGLYGRTYYMPKSSLLTSMTHATEHQFVILSGLVMVWDRETGSKVYAAPYTGVTKPGTRRLLYTFEDTRWKTFHANPDNLTDPDEILKYFTRPHINPLLS